MNVAIGFCTTFTLPMVGRLVADPTDHIRFTALIPCNYQINLFNNKAKMINLYQAIDSIKKRFGESFVMRAASYDEKRKQQTQG